jgi:hypothetical protein
MTTSKDICAVLAACEQGAEPAMGEVYRTARDHIKSLEAENAALRVERAEYTQANGEQASIIVILDGQQEELRARVEELERALSGMLTFYGMDEDPHHETQQVVHNSARQALGEKP